MGEKTDEGQNRNELEALLKSKQRMYKILTKLCWVFLPMLAAPFIPAFCGAEDSTWTYRLTGIAVVSIMIGFAIALIAANIEKQMKELIGQCAVRGVLEEQMQVLEYMPTGHTNEDSLKNCKLLPEYNEVTGSDYIHAIYRGAEITYCDLCLRWRSDNMDPDRPGSSSAVTRFQGPFVTIVLPHNIDGVVHVIERKGGKKPAEAIRLGNTDFDRRFTTLATDEQLAGSILPPDAILRILQLPKDTYLEFAGNQLVAAIYNDADLFEMKDINVNDGLDEYREKCRKELAELLQILDKLIYVARR